MTVEPVRDRIPVSLVTGFLGSGKTTLIAALLRQPAMAGSAVIVNEFGAIGIDDAIFAQSIDAGNVRLLANGCLCCTAGDDLATTVWSLARRAAPPHRIVIETTGLADPAPVLRRLMADPRLARTTRLDTVVATIDVPSGLDNLERQPVAERQCALADRRVITKSDIADPGATGALRRRLRALNPGGEILEISHGDVDADALLNGSLYNSAAGLSDVDRWLNAAAHDKHPHGHDDGHAHHSGTVATWLVEERRLVDWEVFSQCLGPIIARHGDKLLRVKGVIHAHDDPRPIVIHGVQRMFHPPVRLQRWISTPGTKIVVIGEKTAEMAVGEIAVALSEAAQSRKAAEERERLMA